MWDRLENGSFFDERSSGLDGSFGKEVVKVSLVSEDQQRDGVGVGREVGGRVELGGKRSGAGSFRFGMG